MNDTPRAMPEITLNEADRRRICDLAETLDLSDASMNLHYGTAVQRKLAAVSGKMLEMTAEKPAGAIADAVTSLVEELSGAPLKKGFAALFRRRNEKRFRKRSRAAAVNVERLTAELEQHRNTLLRDHVMLGKLEEAVTEHYRELTVHIEAGRRKLEETAEEGDRERFRKRLHDLELSRMVSLQMIPQIQILRDANTALSEKIQSLLTGTVPLWMNQISLALGMESLREVNDEMIGKLNGVLDEQKEHDRQQSVLEEQMKEIANEE